MFSCRECHKAFQYFRNLRSHVQKFHPIKLNELAPTKKKNAERVERNYKCLECSKAFSRHYGLKAHKRTAHGVIGDIKHVKCRKVCPLCNFENEKSEVIAHFESAHNLKIMTDIHEFQSFEMFMTWKEEMEKETMCTFISHSGTVKTDTTTTHYFYCHRSGFYVPRGTGSKHLKFQGTKKINGFCPSSIKAVESEGKFIIQYIKTHVGHENEIAHKFLTFDERHTLATKIAAGIPFDRILTENRESISGVHERLHLLTRHDLNNIKSGFNLGSIKQTNNAVSVESCVDEMENTESLADESSDVLQIHIEENEHIVEHEEILSQLKNAEPCSNISLREKVERVKKSFIQMMDTVTTESEFEAMRKLIKPMQPTLDAIRCQTSTFNLLQSYTANKNKSSQRKGYRKKNIKLKSFFSTKKCGNILCKSKKEELSKVALSLLM